jgi:two-component system, LytTR family, sensor kinase
LKAQLNPHFFFNSINNIYHLIDEDKDEAKEAIMKMSDLLRFQMDECRKESILVRDEISFLKNYIDFESLRKRNEVTVTFDHSELDGQLKIPPLLLMPFVENAFKHVSRSKSKEENVITLRISKQNDSLLFECRNTMDIRGLNESVNKSGIGLQNVMSRLKLIYGEKFVLKVVNDKNWYSVNLTLPC